ncbi:transcription factor MYBS2-like [Andrographis paniculata]|uniref:transcription factor MYBS2-like n=1 Tax=Andrographis paniculata TaxID=175694 RepID=UPI0021E84D06|nr:transcription factor MYBS2-like [Andrographis paniculata]
MANEGLRGKSSEVPKVAKIKLFGFSICAVVDDADKYVTNDTQSLQNSGIHQCINNNNGVANPIFPRERNKAKSWSEDEHRAFLEGLEKLGKGRWKGIAAKYVPSRSATQVASHAQKYFIWLGRVNKQRRSIFDIVSEGV